jgi:hypothetical protein
MKQIKIEYRAVAYRERGLWIGQCLEYDVAVQALEIAKLREEMDLALLANVMIGLELGKGENPLKTLAKAPQRFWDMFEAAQTKVEPPVRRQPSKAHFEPTFHLYEKAA